MPRHSPEDFGEPSLEIAGFQLWVHGRQFPEARDYDDGNWLRVTAHCRASGASVWAEGSILQAQDVLGFGKQCRALAAGEATSATFEPLEPGIRIVLTAIDRLGHITARVEITPDHVNQEHVFSYEIDQSYLSFIVEACERILEEHPLRGVGGR